jgi:hypothetical protein
LFSAQVLPLAATVMAAAVTEARVRVRADYP